MQTLLGVTLPRFARYGWIRKPRVHAPAIHVATKSHAAYLAALLALSRKWPA